ncbi:MAG: (2Fe-2S)-binding protein [Hyphomonadaceae bacterium]|nr:(2Fe-2S)-binding protein [Hyphomonadaceae bacterium]
MPTLTFPGTSFPPLELPERAPLSLHLTASNSPALFGCREGVCGTCLSRVIATNGDLEPPSAHERESLEVYAPDGETHARLLCQLQLTADIAVEKL